MTEDREIPIAFGTAHDSVRTQLESANRGTVEYDCRLTASLCLRSPDSNHREDGATLLAQLADDDPTDIEICLYDLGAALDISHPKTRIQTIGAFEVAAHRVPTIAVEFLDALMPRIEDPEPLVREAACSAVAQIASAYSRNSSWDELPERARENFQDAIDPLFTQVEGDPTDDIFRWETSFAVEQPERTFWGPVEAGESRRSYIRWHATYAIALLAEVFPEEIRERSRCLADLPFEAERGETRGYAVDALGRAGAEEALQDIRNQACEMLDSEETRKRGVSILYSMTMESPALLVEAAPALAGEFDSLDDDERELAGKTVLHAAVYDPREVDETVRELVQAWLSNNEDERHLFGLSAGLFADIAAEHPTLVLPSASNPVELLPENSTLEHHIPNEQTDQWNTERAWDILIETGERAPETVWDAIDTDRLRSKLTSDTSDEESTHARKLYAHLVPLPASGDDLATLFDALLDDRHDARAAVSIFASRAPEQAVQAALRHFKGRTDPPYQVIKILERLSQEFAEELRPLQDTIWDWNGTIQPTDRRWTGLIDIVGRIAIATEDDETISRMLHLKDPVYCKRFLETTVGTNLVWSAPNKTVPPLLEHLSNGNYSLRHRIIDTFDGLPDRFGGWKSPIRDALIECLEDDDWRVRARTVETLDSWPNSGVEETLIEQLDDDDRRVRATTVRTLGSRADSVVDDALADLLASETCPIVRFEVQRATYCGDVA